MKVVDLTCPGCGARLEVDADKKTAFCGFCGAALPIDDEIQKVQLDGAEKAGYDFEKGRQKAQAEAAQTTPPVQQYVQTTPTPPEPPKKRKTWLWVLGWIVIFPVPLTIIMLNKKDMDQKVRYGIIATGWIVYLIIALSGGCSSKAPSTTASQAASSSSSAIVASSQSASADSTAASSASADVSSVAASGVKVKNNTDLDVSFVSSDENGITLAFKTRDGDNWNVYPNVVEVDGQKYSTTTENSKVMVFVEGYSDDESWLVFGVDSGKTVNATFHVDGVTDYSHFKLTMDDQAYSPSGGKNYIFKDLTVEVTQE